MHDGICWAQMCPPNRRRNGTAESHVDTGDEQPLDWDTACVHVHLACAVFDEIRSQWQLHGDVTECGACGQMSVQVLVVSGEHLAGPFRSVGSGLLKHAMKDSFQTFRHGFLLTQCRY